MAVLTDQVQARNKDAVLGGLGELASRVRSSLGESIAGLSAQVKPLPMVTTSSLEPTRDVLKWQVLESLAAAYTAAGRLSGR